MIDTRGGLDLGTIQEIEKQGHYFSTVDGLTSSTDDIAVQYIIDNFDRFVFARDSAYIRINEQLQSYLDNLVTSKYSRAEQDTFPYQRLEVEAWEKDNSTPTPTIDKIALNREVSRDDQLSKVSGKTAYFTDLTDTAIGKSQKIKDQIKASTDLDFINSVNFEG